MPVGDGLAREHRVRLHDVAAMGVLLDGVDEVLQERRALGLSPGGHARDLLAVAVLQHGDEQPLFAAEVVQHAGVRHARLRGDLDERSLVVAAGAEDVHRGLQHRLATLGGLGLRALHSLGRRLRRSVSRCVDHWGSFLCGLPGGIRFAASALTNRCGP